MESHILASTALLVLAALSPAALLPVEDSPSTQPSTSELATQPPLNFSGSASTTDLPPPLGPALGASCNATDICQADASSCQNGKCSCNENYVASNLNLKCLEIVKYIGGDCYESGQCKAGLEPEMGSTTCLNFKCSCEVGWTLVNGKCSQPATLDTVCNTTEDCQIKDTFCSDSICICLPNFRPNDENNGCVQMVRLMSDGDTCSIDEDCQLTLGSSAQCVRENGRRRCMCKDGGFLKDGTCLVDSSSASFTGSNFWHLLGFVILLVHLEP